MKFFRQEPKKSVLFVCVQNAGRSQMAEGFFKKYASKEYEGISAGTMPVSEINPLAVKVMREVNIDISSQKSKEITEDMIRNSSKIVNMDAWTRNPVLCFLCRIYRIGILKIQRINRLKK
jgi:protein-tyrosine-phosphatase